MKESAPTLLSCGMVLLAATAFLLPGCKKDSEDKTNGEESRNTNSSSGGPGGSTASKSLAEFIKDKRIFIDVPSPPAKKGIKFSGTFVQFDSDGTMHFGMIVNDVAYEDPEERGKYVVSGMTINVTVDDGEKSSAVLSKAEPAKGDTITVTEDDGEKKNITIVKVEAAGALQAFPGSGASRGKGKQQSKYVSRNISWKINSGANTDLDRAWLKQSAKAVETGFGPPDKMEGEFWYYSGLKITDEVRGNRLSKVRFRIVNGRVLGIYPVRN